MNIYNFFMDIKNKFDLVRLMEKENLISTFDTTDEMDAGKVDYKILMKEAQENGNKYCTNNNFGIYDEYFETYIKNTLSEKKDSEKESSYANSPEYDAFVIFLNICKEVGIEPLIIMVPVNGKWYDYTGFPKEGREGYYRKIREICKENNVKLADFSDKEYEKYFLRDIMHLGWKGWVYLDEAIYKFYAE